MEIKEKEIGYQKNKVLKEFTFTNQSGVSITCLNYGCIITEFLSPDRNGSLENIVLGFDEVADYVNFSPYFGAVIGRVAGRIKDSSFEIDGKEYILSRNEQSNHLHGGEIGFDKVIWESDMFQSDSSVGVLFSYMSPDGEEGYPGNLDISVTYTLNTQNEFSIEYKGTSDQKTLVNLTNHSYFNLSGGLKRGIYEHIIQMGSEQFLEVREDLVPTGNVLYVDGTPFDLRDGRRLKDGIQSAHPQNVIVGNGYDHAFLFKGPENKTMLKDPESGRVLSISTDQPCLVLYSGNQLSGPFSIRGIKPRKYLGVCLETQGLPDAIHHPLFPSVILDKDEKYHTKTVYSVSVE